MRINYLPFMNFKFILAFAFLLITYSATSQDRFIDEMLESFASIRLWEYEEIPVEWKMEGAIQVDFNEGLNALVEGDPAFAESNFSKALQKDSTLWQVYYFRAASRKQLRKLEHSINDLLRVLELKPQFAEAYIELAKVYHLLGRTSASDSAINLAISHPKAKAVAYYVKGDINLILKNRGEAVHSYSSCLEIDPNFHDARVKLTMSDFMSTYNVRITLQHLNQVLKKDSLQKSALLFRSIVNYDLNKRQSIRDLSSLIRISPFNFLAHYFRGVFYTEVREFEKAFSDFQFVIKNTAANENYFSGHQTTLDKKINLQNAGAYALTRVYGLADDDSRKIQQAYCYLVTNNFSGSIAVIDSLSTPKEPLALYLKAVAFEHMGNHNVAYAFYNKALALDDQIADAHKKRGIYEQELGHWGKSIDDFNAVLKLTPDAFVMFKLRGISNYRLRNFVGAINDFSAYLKNDSTNREVIGYRGMAYLEVNQMLEAYLDFAVSGNFQALNYSEMSKLVNGLVAKGNTSRALYALNIFTSVVPNYTEGYVKKFKLHVQRNEWGEIEKNLPRAIANVSALTTKSDESYLYTLQAMIAAAKGEFETALNKFDHAIVVDSNNKLANQERKKLLVTLGITGEQASNRRNASKGNQKKSSTDILQGDWVRARAEFMDGRELPVTHIGRHPQRFSFAKNKVIGWENCLTTSADFIIEGNKLQLGLVIFTIESATSKEIRLLDAQSSYPARYILIPTDSFTLSKKFHYTVNQSDTVYNCAAGIEPLYMGDNFMHDVLKGFRESVAFSFDFVVNKDGLVDEVIITSSTNSALNKRFIEAVKKTSGNWKPGKIGNRAISVKCNANFMRSRI